MGKKEIDIRKIFQKNWLELYTRPNTLQQCQHYAWSTTERMKKILGIDLQSHLYLITKNQAAIFFFDEKEREALRKHAAEVCLNNPLFLRNYNKQLLSVMKVTERALSKISRLNLSKISNKQLAGVFEQYLNIINKGFSSTWVAVLIEDIVENKLKGVLSGKIKEWEKSIKVIAAPLKANHLLREQIDLLKIAAKKNQDANLKKHWQKYNYIPCYDIHVKPFSEEYFRKRLQGYIAGNPKLKLAELKKSFFQNKIKLRKLIKSLKLNNKEKSFIMAVNEFAYVKDERSHSRSIFTLAGKRIYKEIAKRNNVRLQSLTSMTDDEIKNLTINHKKPSNIENRLEKSIYVKIGGYEQVLSGSIIEEIEKKIRTFQKISSVQGISANSGRALGKAKIIANPNEITKVKRGDILITGMTRPHYITAMQKAGAIVTDEGGALCHAAIVAREMNKPCVIGTKIATKIFKDGDYVEVDADKGIVRKIK